MVRISIIRLLRAAPSCWCQSEPSTVAQTIRQLGDFCDWEAYRWATERVDAGVDYDGLPAEIKRIEAEQETITGSPEAVETIENASANCREINERSRRSHRLMKHVEGMMGFDIEATKKIIDTLGPRDENAVHNSVLELLPEELGFPMRRRDRSMPYDHRLHLLVEELLTRMGDDARSTDEIIKDCGHIVCHLRHHENKEVAARLLLHQAILLADDYVQSTPWEIIGDCWRGELACLEHSRELAKEYAEKVRRRSAGQPSLISTVTWFFALTTYTDDVFGEGISEHYGYVIHLGELNYTWIDREQTLALAIVRAAFRHGNWDTSLLLATFALRDHGYSPEPDDAPAECWVWMAEQIEDSPCENYLYFDTHIYYEYWCNAFSMRTQGDRSQGYAHNIIIVLLTGLLYHQIRGDYEPPSIQQVLDALIDLHRNDSFPQNYIAALETIEFFYNFVHRFRQTATNHLTAGDKLALSKSLEHLKRLRRYNSQSARTNSDIVNSSRNQINIKESAEAESYIREAVGKEVWSKLGGNAKREFRNGEIHYRFAERFEGETGDFNAFVMAYAKGVLVQIQESLKGPLLKNPSLSAEYSSIFADNKHPEWREILLSSTIVGSMQAQDSEWRCRSKESN